jgi:MFS family permease
MLEKSATATESTSPTIRSPNKLQRVFRHRDFRLLWTGAFLSFIGSWIQTIAQGYLVYQITKSEYLLGLVSFFGMLPVTIFGLFAGSLTDTLNKRFLLVVTQAIFALGAGFLAAATYFEFVQYWHIVVVALVLGTVSAIEMPTRQSIISKVVPPEDLAVAIPINALTFNMARLVGPAIGGVLLSSFGPALCYLVNGLSFFALIFAGLAIRADLRATEREPQPIWDLVVEGALYTWRDIRLRMIFVLESVVSMFGLFYLTQIPAIADKMLGVPETGLWGSYLAVGVGSVLALITVTTLSEKPVKALLLRLAITAIGAALIVLALTRSEWLAYPLFAILGFASVTMFNTCNTLFQTLSPERLRGRVLSMHIWALSGLGPFGVWGFGFIAQSYGLRMALELGGVLVLLAALYGWIYRRGLEGVR